MEKIGATDAKADFEVLIDRAQDGPIMISKGGRAVGMNLRIALRPISCTVLAMVCGSLVAAPAPGCKRSLRELTELETALKRDIKIPFDPQTNPVKGCDITQPVVTSEVRRAGKPSIAIFVFDVTSTGRVAGLQLIGKKTHWSEIAQEEVSQWLFEPLYEGDVGITRVGVTAAVIAELEGRGQSCGQAQSPVKADLEVRVCASR